MKCTHELRTNMAGLDVIIRRFVCANGYQIMIIWEKLHSYSYIEMQGTKNLTWNESIEWLDRMYEVYGGDMIET